MKKQIPSSLLSKKLTEFYDQASEEDRLNQGLGPLEFERNKSLIGRHLTNEPMTIVDVGGGTGKYSAWLATLGHKVILIEPMEKHLKKARKRAEKKGQHFEIQQGEARELFLEDASVDVIILHGPLYHLQHRNDRLKAIQEAYRVLKPGGCVLGFAINYTASTFVGLLQGVIHQPDIFNMCYSELETGIHDAPDTMPGILTEAYYHKPETLLEEFEKGSFQNLKLFAVEGIIWLEKNFFSVRGDKEKYKNLQKLLEITETDPNLIAMSPHMMIAGMK